MVKISGCLLYLKPVENHACPLCEEKLERRPRRFWQRAVSFAIPFRHYQCGSCYKEFLAISGRWSKVPLPEKVLRIVLTGGAVLLAVYVFLRVMFIILASVMA